MHEGIIGDKGAGESLWPVENSIINSFYGQVSEGIIYESSWKSIVNKERRKYVVCGQ